MMKLRKHNYKTLGRNKIVASLSYPPARARPAAKNDQKMIKPVSLDTNFHEDVTSHVLSFKCLFCEAYIFTLQSFIIHLKSSHPNEDVSGMLSDHFRSCIVSVEKEKVVVVSYAFPRQDVDLYLSVDDVPSTSDTTSCLRKKSPYRNVGEEEHRASNVDQKTAASRADASEISIKQSFASSEAHQSIAISGTGKSRSYSECSSSSMNGDRKQETNGTKSDAICDAQIAGCPKPGPLDILVNSSSSGGTKNCTASIVPTVLVESTRRRQMTSFEKMMALTCQKCGQKFKNRCMLTRHVIEHKRANNPYRCTVNGCLDSYSEKRKLIGHLSYKHVELTKEEREAMLMKGDELLEKLRDTPQSGSLACCSGALPSSFAVISPITAEQKAPSPAPSLSQTTIPDLTTATANSDEPVATISAFELMSTNNILKNMVENADASARNEVFLKEVKVEVPDTDSVEVESASPTTASTCHSSSYVKASVSLISESVIVPERDPDVKLNTSSAVILKRNPGKRSMTVRELLGLGATSKQKIKCGKFVRSA